MQKYRDDFPLLSERHNIIYLDNAATTQKPRQTLDALIKYYERDNSNVHRGIHELSEVATQAYEHARDVVCRYVNASHRNEIIWTRGTTESINLVSNSYGRKVLTSSSNVVISEMEHHSNIVPWQLACSQSGSELRAARVTARGELDFDHLASLIDENTKIVAVAHVSNALGTVNPIAEIARLVHEVGGILVVDGAQGIVHGEVDVQRLNCDFYAFSGHKVYGPTGIGVLYGRRELLEKMPPWQGGGEMIKEVTLQRTTYQDLPYRFEAGTPDISGAIGLQTALEYVTEIGISKIVEHEAGLLRLTTELMQSMNGVRIVGEAPEKAPLVSFLVEGSHPHDIGMLLDQQGVAVRTGHHCAMPLMQALQIPGTVRASFALYNSEDDVYRLIAAVQKAQQLVAD